MLFVFRRDIISVGPPTAVIEICRNPVENRRKRRRQNKTAYDTVKSRLDLDKVSVYCTHYRSYTMQEYTIN